MRDAGHRTPDIGHRTTDIGHRTAKKAKIIYPPPRGVDITISRFCMRLKVDYFTCNVFLRNFMVNYISGT